MNPLTLIIIQVVVFTSYILFIIKDYGVQPSISDSWYRLPPAHNWLFSIFIWGMAFPLAMFGTVWFFWAGALLAFVGAATMFKSLDKFTPTIHYVGASGGILLAAFALLAKGIWYPLVGIIVATVVLKVLREVKNDTWWVEVCAFVILEIGMVDCFVL